MIEISEIAASDTYPFRINVLRKNIPLPYKFKGDLHEATIHLGAFKIKKLIAVSSFIKVNNPNLKGIHFQLKGTATLEVYRGDGAGKLLIQHSIKI